MCDLLEYADAFFTDWENMISVEQELCVMYGLDYLHSGGNNETRDQKS